MADQCPLNPARLPSTKWFCDQIIEIQEHIFKVCNCPHPPLKDLVLSGSLEGSTPLIMACADGDLEAVKYIIERWEVDIQAAATYYPWPEMFTDVEKVRGATPLFVAASRGHPEIVRYLIGEGANVSVKTSTESGGLFAGLTPLHGAIISLLPILDYTVAEENEKMTIIRLLLESGADPSDLFWNGTPIWLMRCCDVNVTLLLIEHGMDVNQSSPSDGTTILHHWTRRDLEHKGSLDVIQLLLDKGADSRARDKNGITPILLAAIGDNVHPNLSVLDFLLERNEISRSEKVDALEMAGAVILGNTENEEKFYLAFYYWHRALNLRLMNTEGLVPILKTSFNRNSRITEWSTLAQLEQIEERPSQYKIQSIFVRLRILSSTSWRAIHHYLCPSVHQHLRTLMEQRRLAESFDISWTMLETIGRYDPNEEGLWSTTIKIQDNLVRSLANLRKGEPLLSAETFRISMELIYQTNQIINLVAAEPNQVTTLDHLLPLCKLISNITELPILMNENVIMRSLFHLVRRSGRDRNGRNLLHIACMLLKTNVMPTVRLLLQTGADGAAVDHNGESSLHILAKRDGDWIDTTARLLLDAGAHLDRVNREGKTAADILSERMGYDRRGYGWINLPDWCKENVPKLSCVSARVVHRYESQYEAILNELPTNLQSFVAMH